MTEADGRKWLKHMIASNNLQFQPIESGGTGLGIPDVFVQSPAGHLWIELKIGFFVAQGVRVVFRPGQLTWLKTNVLLGGRVALMMFVPNDEDSDFSWWVFKRRDIKAFYTMEELTSAGVGYITSKVTSERVLDALFINL
jgi:hypothetical protein